MFDISWSELLILGVVTLIFVGPKELPVFLRTIGKYVGMMKRQAGEFREQFDSAMREAELEQIRKDMMGVKTDVEKSVNDAGRSVTNEFDEMRAEFDNAATGTSAATSGTPAHDPDAHDADGIPLARPNFDPPKPAVDAPAAAAVSAAPAHSAAKAAADAAAAARANGPAGAAEPRPADAVKSGV